MSKKPKRRSVKPKASPDFKNLHHPEYIGLIEESGFSVRGVKYYNFKNDTQVRTGRYMFIQNFLQEVYYRMDLDRLKAYIKRVREEIDGTKGTINVGNATAFLDQMKTLTELAFEPDTVYRLASVIYFDETEDVTKWDREYNEKKILAWKAEGALDFFYRKPFSELMGLKDISETDLRDYLDKVRLMIDVYNTSLYETPTHTSKSSTMSV